MKNGFAILSVFLLLLLISGCAQTVQDDQVVEITDTSLLDVQERGKLIVGTTGDYYPMTFTDESGNFMGVDMEIINEVSNGLGVEVEIKQSDWKELFTKIKSNSVDVVISSVTITPERSEEILFSVPYFIGGQVIVVKKNHDQIEFPEDLRDRMVGTIGGTTCEKAALEYVEKDQLYLFVNGEEAIAGLLNDTVEAVVGDYVAGVGAVKAHPDDLKLVGEPLTQEFYGIATRLGNNALMDEINKILREMKRSGKLKEIENKWLG